VFFFKTIQTGYKSLSPFDAKSLWVANQCYIRYLGKNLLISNAYIYICFHILIFLLSHNKETGKSDWVSYLDWT